MASTQSLVPSTKIWKVLEEIDSGDNYRILSFDREQLEKMVELKDVPEMHDRIIAAVADVERFNKFSWG